MEIDGVKGKETLLKLSKGERREYKEFLNSWQLAWDCDIDSDFESSPYEWPSSSRYDKAQEQIMGMVSPFLSNFGLQHPILFGGRREENLINHQTTRTTLFVRHDGITCGKPEHHVYYTPVVEFGLKERLYIQESYALCSISQSSYVWGFAGDIAQHIFPRKKGDGIKAPIVDRENFEKRQLYVTSVQHLPLVIARLNEILTQAGTKDLENLGHLRHLFLENGGDNPQNKFCADLLQKAYQSQLRKLVS
jgi:hypothetical protein